MKAEYLEINLLEIYQSFWHGRYIYMLIVAFSIIFGLSYFLLSKTDYVARFSYEKNYQHIELNQLKQFALNGYILDAGLGIIDKKIDNVDDIKMIEIGLVLIVTQETEKVYEIATLVRDEILELPNGLLRTETMAAKYLSILDTIFKYKTGTKLISIKEFRIIDQRPQIQFILALSALFGIILGFLVLLGQFYFRKMRPFL